MGVHQKIDRVARRHLARHIKLPASFPGIREILHFEGLNGPDGIKRKSPGKDEPWHYIDALEPHGAPLMTIIHDHIYNLSEALKADNRERAAFEAAWLAHAITDGLTPAHHYPLEEKLTELRGGEGLETRNSKLKKLVIPGKTKRQMLKNNWEFWGAKGVMTTHLHFELGIMTAISAMKFDTLSFTEELRDELRQEGFDNIFKASVKRIADMGMYEEFIQKGWTRHIANETKNVLVPEIIRMVMLGWMAAIVSTEEDA